ncbi:MAG: radical SAM/SPASM domain-containing protein [Candidatus Omnitrophota bacterium]
MKKRRFRPTEVLFSLTARCNLRCGHCNTEPGGAALGRKGALRFLAGCSDLGIKRVGFTGGEPFLALDLLCAIIKEAVRRGMLFGRIMTNGAWFNSKKELIPSLEQIYRAGYDGDICVSVDAFHRQDLKKVASFIRAAREIWNRPDIISVAAVKGAMDSRTGGRLLKLSRLLGAAMKGAGSGHACIKGGGLFIRISYIDLSPVGKAARLKDPWNGRWFRDDFCEGPGNLFYILPDGTIKPCCGYANGTEMLTLGSIKTDTPQKLLRNAGDNRLISAIFGSGLHPVRKALETSGVRFPGMTTNHCLFCHYITHNIPRQVLERSLGRICDD